MHKFQNLKSFKLNRDTELHEKSETNLTTKTFAKFISFVTNISNYSIEMHVDRLSQLCLSKAP
jgi:hypothetical protein